MGAQGNSTENAGSAWRGKMGWERPRAALIAYFVVFNVLAAVPSPGSASAERFERPQVKAELSRWVATLAAVGIDADPRALQSSYLSFCSAAERARTLALAPLAWWFELSKTGQGWQLFGIPRERPSALEVLVRRAGRDEVLYRSADAAHRWHADLIEYRRIRRAYSPLTDERQYAALAERLSELAFAESADVESVSVSLLVRHTVEAGALPDRNIERVHVRSFSRAGRE